MPNLRVGLPELRKRLKSDPCDVVLIGGGVVADEKFAVFIQQIIDVTRDEAPGTKVLEFDRDGCRSNCQRKMLRLIVTVFNLEWKISHD